MGHRGRTFPECSNLPHTHSLPNEAKKLHYLCMQYFFELQFSKLLFLSFNSEGAVTLDFWARKISSDTATNKICHSVAPFFKKT